MSEVKNGRGQCCEHSGLPRIVRADCISATSCEGVEAPTEDGPDSDSRPTEPWLRSEEDCERAWALHGDCLPSDAKRPELQADAVNHPTHYTSHPSGIECIHVAEHMTFCIGNAIKYCWRAGLKGNGKKHIEDLEKARWYIDREIMRLNKEST